MFTRITVAAGSLLTTVSLLSGAAMVHAGAASADSSQDDHFLALLDQKGVSALSGVPALIATAHQICGSLASGMSADALVAALVDNANNVTLVPTRAASCAPNHGSSTQQWKPTARTTEDGWCSPIPRDGAGRNMLSCWLLR